MIHEQNHLQCLSLLLRESNFDSEFQSCYYFHDAINQIIYLHKFLNRTLWFMISSVFCKSAGFIPVKRLEFKPVNVLSVRYEIDVQWFLQNRDFICRELNCLLDIP